jgi:hypothetical protein
MTGEYTYEELIDLLDSDDPPPAPLTRKQIRETIQHFDRASVKAKEYLFQLYAQIREQQRNNIICKLEEAREIIRQHEAALAWELMRLKLNFNMFV